MQCLHRTLPPWPTRRNHAYHSIMETIPCYIQSSRAREIIQLYIVVKWLLDNRIRAGLTHFVALVDRPQIVSRSMDRLIHIMTTRKPIPTTNCTIQEIREIINFWCRNKTFLWECLRSYDVGNASITDQIV